VQDIIKWLINIEQLAGNVYAQASEYFEDDPKFKKFLDHLTEDEAWHYHLMMSASEFFRENPPPVPVISIDEETNDRIVGDFNEVSRKIISNSLTKEFLLDAIINAEFSEWNDIFLYVANSLKERSREFSYAAPKIQLHKRAMEHYFENIPGGLKKIQKLKGVDPVWEGNILIIENEELIRDMFGSLLMREGSVDTAFDGKEALGLLEKKVYKLILSDIEMPIMDGITFYEEAVKLYPDIADSFLFISGRLTPERKVFFEKNKISYMTRPAPIRKILNNAMKVLLKNR